MCRTQLNMITPYSSEKLESVRALFQEYANALSFDLCFQDFEKELTNLPGEYAPPHGALYLASLDGNEIGCVALRRIDETICEMKRLYVKPSYRKTGIGRELVQSIIDEAKQLGYKHMRLDTVPSMKEAISLYQSFGFKSIDPYRHNPIEGAIFMELAL